VIRLTILYPNSEGATFDIDYYLNTHVPLSKRLQSPSLKSFAVDHGFGTGVPDEKPPFLVIANLVYDSMEAFIEAFMPHMEELQGDIGNYTNVVPIIQFSEILLD
jgi:uncharacterized protein (TIGR02118 family)